MPSMIAIVIEKSGSIKEIKLKEDDEYYKKAGFKSSSDFAKQTSWEVKCNGKQMQIDLYGKTKGRAGQENKYEFPPPVDNSNMNFHRLLIMYFILAVVYWWPTLVI